MKFKPFFAFMPTHKKDRNVHEQAGDISENTFGGVHSCTVDLKMLEGAKCSADDVPCLSHLCLFAFIPG